MSRRWILLALVVFVSCGGSTPDSPAIRDWIELKTISPAAGATLTAGERVTFTATVECTVTRQGGGTVGLLVMDQANRALGTTPPVSMALPSGTTTVTLLDTAVIPSGGTVTVVLPLFVSGSNVTRAMKMVTYTVG